MNNHKDRYNIQWHDYIFEVLLTYNNKLKHDSHGFTPADAVKHEKTLMLE
jgi:hypothetical protein